MRAARAYQLERDVLRHVLCEYDHDVRRVLDALRSLAREYPDASTSLLLAASILDRASEHAAHRAGGAEQEAECLTTQIELQGGAS